MEQTKKTNNSQTFVVKRINLNSPVFNEMQNERLTECSDVDRDVRVVTSSL